MHRKAPINNDRRIVLRTLAALGASSLALKPAFAAPSPEILKLPTSIAYMRFDQNGVVRMKPDDRGTWELMARHLGGLVERMEPFEYSAILPMPAPITDGGASAALHARNMASQAGYDYILIFAIMPPEKEETELTPKSAEIEDERQRRLGPRARAFQRVKWVFSGVSKPPSFIVPEKTGDVVGEAHLIAAQTGAVIASSWSSIPENKSRGIFREKYDAEDHVLQALSADMERRIQDLARLNYHNGRSLAD